MHGPGHHRASTTASVEELDPEEYKSARHKLKVATLEYYRYLSMLKSYRILNRTGFNKILKKFQKTSDIPCAEPYLGKVSKTQLVQSTKLEELSGQIENFFTRQFEHGNRKRALEKLRVQDSLKSHHFSAFRAGLMVGLAIPAIVDGVVKATREGTHRAIPEWAGLLQIFGAELLPVLHACLFAVCLIVWRRARVNYVLIFELNMGTMMDFREYIELPAMLLFTLAWAFWLAFTVPPSAVSPHAWPLAWLVFAVCLLFNPLPVYWPSARWWLIRSMCRVVTAGGLRVQFRDFFLGDQLVSLSYSFVTVGFLICAYSRDWNGIAGGRCGTNSTYTSFILASVPSLLRLGQSLRRYYDSGGARLHMVNAGKYSMTCLYYAAYYHWRVGGSEFNGRLAFWVVFGVLNSTYSLAWDLLMDWGLFRPNNKHRFLRRELAYDRQAWFYYWGIFSDLLLRFTWLFYFWTTGGPSTALKGFLVALLEIFRRTQWNVLRFESEHIGNADAYRVTKETPLPYPVHNRPTPEDEEEDDRTQTEKVVAGFRRAAMAIGRFKTMLPGRSEPNPDRDDPESAAQAKASVEEADLTPQDSDSPITKRTRSGSVPVQIQSSHGESSLTHPSSPPRRRDSIRKVGSPSSHVGWMPRTPILRDRETDSSSTSSPEDEVGSDADTRQTDDRIRRERRAEKRDRAIDDVVAAPSSLEPPVQAEGEPA